ncbi:MAG: ATP-binding protein, partial [Dehalococcoidales bacterium]
FITKFRSSLDNLGQNSNINYQFNSQTTSLHLDSLVEFELLRICQEALTNVKKHSGADNVEIQIRPVNNHIEVSITDNGCGFDVMAVNNNNGSKVEGHGLAVMQERAELIGGQFLVLSTPGHGTEVKVELPSNSHRSDPL